MSSRDLSRHGRWTMASIGLILLFGRRLVRPRILVTSSQDDIMCLMLLFVVGWGTFNAFFMRYDVIYTIAPWIRSIVTFSPDPELMRPVPWTYKVHILAALALLEFLHLLALSISGVSDHVFSQEIYFIQASSCGDYLRISLPLPQ